MKTIAVILAGGIGSRIGGKLPKQFLIVNNKPVIVHTIVNFEKNSRVDGIVIVCEKNWIDYLKQMIEDFKITKIVDVIPGGETGHVSTSNAIFYLKEFLSPDDYVIIHDAARPILPQQAINNNVYENSSKRNASYKEYSAAGIYADGSTRITIKNNIVAHNDFGIELASENAGQTTSEVEVKNNVIYSNNGAGIIAGGAEQTNGGASNNIIAGNFLLFNDRSEEGYGEITMQWNTRENQEKSKIHN